MKTRIITGAFILLAMIAVLCLSSTPVYPLVLSVLAVIAAIESLGVLQLRKKYVLSIPAYAIAAVMPSLAYIMCVILKTPIYKYIVALALVMFVYVMYLFVVAVFERGRLKFANLSAAYVLVAYIIICFSALSLIMYIRDIGFYCLGMVLIGAWMSDTMAYFTGVLFGKHKLIPELSPKKTIEGAIGGVVGTTAAFILYGFIVSLLTELTPNYLVLGLSAPILSVVGQIGDLFASLVKREAGVKDYGKILPGHGGIMDRFDSILSVSGATMVIVLLFTPFY